MSDPALLPELVAQLSETRCLYEAVHSHLARWQALATIERGIAEYNGLIAREEAEFKALRQRRELLDEEHERLRSGGRPQPEPFIPTSRPDTQGGWYLSGVASRGGTPGSASSGAARMGKIAMKDMRHGLKVFVHRFAYDLGLSDGLIKAINRIADSPEHSLGEALAMLEWRVFEQPAHSNEGPQRHLERLRSWATALDDYDLRLQEQIAQREIRYQRVLAIWERWYASGGYDGASQSDAGRRDWEEFVESSRAAKRARNARLKEDIRQLEREVEGLKPQHQDNG
jgi:cell division protein FtsB